jgi:TatD DNase family protein
MIDTHCHLNFKRFKKTLEETISASRAVGVTTFIVPGTDEESSRKAVEIAESHAGIYAAVGFHPHNLFEIRQKTEQVEQYIIDQLTPLLTQKKVVAVGEVGLDRHLYEETKYPDYHLSDQFLKDQVTALTIQIQLAETHHKSLILHNRETKATLLPLLSTLWSSARRKKTVLHCCEPDQELLAFAQKNDCFIGVDGDITYDGEKELFIREVPLSMLVLETDSPFLLPEPLKSKRLYPNTPATIPLIAAAVAKVQGVPLAEVISHTTHNAQELFLV